MCAPFISWAWTLGWLKFVFNNHRSEALVSNQQADRGLKHPHPTPVKSPEAGWVVHNHVCIGINIAWSSWHHLSGSYQCVCWSALNKYKPGQTSSMFRRRKKWVNNTYLCQQFLGSFPVCNILSRKTTELFLKPSIYDSIDGTIQ